MLHSRPTWLALALAAALSGCAAPSYAPTPAPTEPQASSWRTLAVSGPTRSFRVVGMRHQTVFDPARAVGIGGPLAVTQVSHTAYNDVTRQRPFLAMLGFDRGRYGYRYARVTPANAGQWSSDAGNPGPVSFLDTADGLGDNGGDWTYAMQDPSGATVLATAGAKSHVTTWTPSAAAYTDLGYTARRYRVGGTYLTAGDSTSLPGVVLVYTRPDGVRDFTLAAGPGRTGFPDTIEAWGYVYAFYLTDTAGASLPDVSVSLTPVQ